MTSLQEKMARVTRLPESRALPLDRANPRSMGEQSGELDLNQRPLSFSAQRSSQDRLPGFAQTELPPLMTATGDLNPEPSDLDSAALPLS